MTSECHDDCPGRIESWSRPTRRCTAWALLTGALMGGAAHSQSSPPTASAEPIKIGAISSLALFPEATAGARAYFDAVNANGGVKGRRLQFIVEDDRAQPEAAAGAARKLVEREGVVANVGSASALECAVNGRYYEAKGVVAIQGTGTDPHCFSSANIAPVNTGPYTGVELGLRFLSDVRHKERICLVVMAVVPMQVAVFEKAAATWAQQSGKRLAFSAIGVLPVSRIDSLLASVREARCDGVMHAGVEPAIIEWVRAANRLQVKGIDWVFLTPAYTEHVARTLGPQGDGIFAMSEFEPWSSRSGMLTDWRNVMAASKVPLTSFSQGGYVAASVFVSVLRTIRGEITRESVTAAFKAMAPRTVPLIGTPYVFGAAAAHTPNRAAVPVKLEGGKWVVAHFDYIVLPPATESAPVPLAPTTAPNK